MKFSFLSLRWGQFFLSILRPYLGLGETGMNNWIIETNVCGTISSQVVIYVKLCKISNCIWKERAVSAVFGHFARCFYFLVSCLTSDHNPVCPSQVRWLLPRPLPPPPPRPPAHWLQQSCWHWPTRQCLPRPPPLRTLGYQWSAGDRRKQRKATALST